QWAVRVADLQSHLLRYKPDIVHFSGHGSLSNEIILEDNDRNSQPVSIRSLSQLFSTLKDDIRCVVLNACYSEQQAQAIAKSIDCVVGMSKAIGDEAAISFAIAFYQALGYGKDIRTAFDLGCVQIDLENLNEQDTPKLLAINSNPKEIVLINKESLFSRNHQLERDEKPRSQKKVDNLSITTSVLNNKVTKLITIIACVFVILFIVFAKIKLSKTTEDESLPRIEISGTVRDIDFHPIKDAEIRIISVHFQATSKLDGTFAGILGGKSKGDQIKLMVWHPKYQTCYIPRTLSSEKEWFEVTLLK
ncbi:MAG: CHAT domain-containing protein, partial [Nitrosopumilaceae archaeon]